MRAGLGSSLAPSRPADRNKKQSNRHELWGHFRVSNNNLMQICQSVTPGTHQHNCTYIHMFNNITQRVGFSMIMQQSFMETGSTPGSITSDMKDMMYFE